MGGGGQWELSDAQRRKQRRAAQDAYDKRLSRMAQSFDPNALSIYDPEDALIQERDRLSGMTSFRAKAPNYRYKSTVNDLGAAFAKAFDPSWTRAPMPVETIDLNRSIGNKYRSRVGGALSRVEDLISDRRSRLSDINAQASNLPGLVEDVDFYDERRLNDLRDKIQSQRTPAERFGASVALDSFNQAEGMIDDKFSQLSDRRSDITQRATGLLDSLSEQDFRDQNEALYFGVEDFNNLRTEAQKFGADEAIGTLNSFQDQRYDTVADLQSRERARSNAQNRNTFATTAGRLSGPQAMLPQSGTNSHFGRSINNPKGRARRDFGSGVFGRQLGD